MHDVGVLNLEQCSSATYMRILQQLWKLEFFCQFLGCDSYTGATYAQANTVIMPRLSTVAGMQMCK